MIYRPPLFKNTLISLPIAAEDLQVQLILKGMGKRTQQIKDAALPDTQKLSLIQRYRTADERQFSKTLDELLELQKRRKNV